MLNVSSKGQFFDNSTIFTEWDSLSLPVNLFAVVCSWMRLRDDIMMIILWWAEKIHQVTISKRIYDKCIQINFPFVSSRKIEHAMLKTIEPFTFTVALFCRLTALFFPRSSTTWFVNCSELSAPKELQCIMIYLMHTSIIVAFVLCFMFDS